MAATCIASSTDINTDSVTHTTTEAVDKKIPAAVDGMPVTYGYVGGHKVRVLRDSGCNTVIVKDSLVSKDQFTCQNHECTLIDGTTRKFPTACVDINTPYLKGKVNAICITNPVYDLVIGNVQRSISVIEHCL